MDITPLAPKGRPVIERYGNGGFVVNSEPLQGSVLILEDRVVRWNVSSIRELSEDSLAQLFRAYVPEILLIGTGATFVPLAASLKEALRVRGTLADAMDTGAACRTYNVLMNEDRSVAAALIAV